jgi:putative Ca2+/H+ antiporter (TMEM165/GDT1 family)
MLNAMNWPLFASVFALIFLAELPDKTSFATMLMASRGKPLAVFTGVALAFLVQTVVAVVFGNVIALAPERWVHLGTAMVFFVFAGMALWDQNDEEEEAEGVVTKSFLPTVWQSFLVIFIAEWGDITQLATAAFAAQNKNEVATVFVGALLALWSATAVTVLIGARLSRYVSATKLQRVSAIAFAVVGGILFYKALVL